MCQFFPDTLEHFNILSLFIGCTLTIDLNSIIRQATGRFTDSVSNRYLLNKFLYTTKWSKSFIRGADTGSSRPAIKTRFPATESIRWVRKYLRSGGRVMYGILGIGYNHKTKDSGLSTEGGLGAHINLLKWFRINHEIKGRTLCNFSDKATFYANYSLFPVFRVNPHFEIFGGPSLNYLQSDNTNNTRIFPEHSLWKKFGESKPQQLYIGFQTGIQYIF